MKRVLLGLLTIWVTVSGLFAQEIKNPEGVPNLIISEMRWDRATRFYWEVTNMEDTAIDLSSFCLFFTTTGAQYSIDEVSGFLTWDYNPENVFRFQGTLGPKESYVLMRVEDRAAGETHPYNTWSSHQDQLLSVADTFLHAQEQYTLEFLDAPELQAYGRDSLSGPNQTSVGELMWGAGSWRTYLGLQLCYTPDTADINIVVDCLLSNLDPDKGGVSATSASCAGVFDPSVENILIRKSTITKPQADWYKSAGIDTEDSEWILLPVNNNDVSVASNIVGSVQRPGDRIPFTTVGMHGDYPLDVTSDVVDVDLDAGTITVPWGTKVNEGLIEVLNFGPNNGWYYKENPANFMDSLYTICMEGDTLEVYAAGADLAHKSLAVKVLPAATDMAMVFDNRMLDYPEDDDPEGTMTTWGNTPFMTTEGEPGMDSVTRVPFATRTDTLFNYLTKAEKADWEIVWVDGTDRVDVMDGDILKVTAEDGTEKEYYISVLDFEKSDVAILSSITWPDYPADDLLDWNQGDTLPGFTPNKTSYIVKLPYWTTDVPALIAKAVDPNAEIMQDRAMNLKGDNALRTTTFTVVPESGHDSLIVTYTVRFEKDMPPEFIQKYTGDPFISEILSRWYYGGSAIEVCNPTDEPLDLSKYMFTCSQLTNPAEALVEWTDHSTEASFNTRFYNYVPGRVFQAKDTATWMTLGGLLEVDPAVNSTVLPKDVFVMYSTHQSKGIAPGMERYSPYLVEEAADVVFNDGLNPWGLPLPGYKYPTDVYGRANVFMWEITADSVLDGDKKLGVDPDDYELIDVFGWEDLSNRAIADRVQSEPSLWEWKFFKKAEFYKPNNTLEGGFGTNADDSEWVAQDRTVSFDGDRTDMVWTVGNHNLVPITEHISMVSSIFLLVSDGFEGTQTIEGIAAGTTVGELTEMDSELLMRADDAQMLVVKSSAGADKGVDDAIEAGDQLVVTSANGEATTTYDLTISDLDGDNVLVAIDGSGLTVTVDGETGMVGGMTPDASIASVLEGLTRPDLAVLNVVDADNNMVATMVMSYDTMLVDVTVSMGVYLEVTAQNGDVVLYALMPDFGEGVYVTSDVFAVDQEEPAIMGIPEGIGVAGFLKYVYGTPGSVVTIVDKAGIERMSYTLSLDDKLMVTSEDGSQSKAYYLDFLNEENLGRNQAPMVEVSDDITAEINATVAVMATATDDELPYPPGLTYAWSVTSGEAGDVVIANPDQAETDVSFNNIGDYVLTVAVSDGELVTEAAISATISWPVSAPEMGAASMRLYPNPAKDHLMLELSNLEQYTGELKVIDITGKTVIHTNIAVEKTQIDLTDLDAGIYFVRVKVGDDSFHQKVHLLK